AVSRLADYRAYVDAPEQLDQLAAECGAVLLAWAEAEAAGGAARPALQLLDGAARLLEAHHQQRPRVFHLRPAGHLAQLGEADAAGAERAAAQGQPGDTPLDLFVAALEAFQRHDYGAASAACGRVLRQEPEHVWAQYLQGVCCFREGRWGEARIAFTACLRPPGLAWARLLRATAESRLDQGDAAEADFAEVLRQAADSEDQLL